jgi:ethanolamine ammonia-lyase large subunit
MDTQPLQDNLNEAMTAIRLASQNPDNSDEMQAALDALAVHIQDMQNDAVLGSEQDLVTALTADNGRLQALAKQVNDLAAQLDHVAGSIRQVSNILGTTVNIVTGILSVI